MRKLLALVLLLAATSAFAQTGTLSSAIVPPTQTTIVVGDITEHRADPNVTGDLPRATVTLWLLTGAGARADTWTVFLSGNAEMLAFETARSTAVGGEIANTAQNYRVLTYLKANCQNFQVKCPAVVNTLTLAP